jgi:chromate transporter
MTPDLWGALDWPALFFHFAALSLLSISGAITTVPDMHRFLVDQRGWMSDAQFTASIAIAQAAPGPNVLFVALMGWHAGLNAAGYAGAALGLVLAMVGIMVPSSLLAYGTARWSHVHRERRAVRAFKQGMAPVVVALLVATGWILAGAGGAGLSQVPLWILTAVTALVVWRTRVHLLWLLAAGGVAGALGWV